MDDDIIRGILKVFTFLMRSVLLEFIDWIGASVIRIIDSEKDSRGTRLSKVIGWILIAFVLLFTYYCMNYFTG
uniref:hypothetical protein n=2 Tax=Vibrio TaxID=662 RepID=UPI00215E6C24|nr:hypothetical protein [Vibrio alginolyticus]UUM00149.1 hypothetical protein [Vibrio alginolyticus]